MPTAKLYVNKSADCPTMTRTLFGKVVVLIPAVVAGISFKS